MAEEDRRVACRHRRDGAHGFGCRRNGNDVFTAAAGEPLDEENVSTALMFPPPTPLRSDVSPPQNL